MSDADRSTADIINKIADEVAGDQSLGALLMKAAQQGVERLLRKGMAAEQSERHEEPDGDEGGEGGEGGDGDGDEGGEGGEGGEEEPMNKGSDDTIDATEFIQDLAAQVVALNKSVNALTAQNAAQRTTLETLLKAVTDNDTSLRADLAAALAPIAPMAKAVMDTNGRIGGLDKLVAQPSQVLPHERAARAAAVRAAAAAGNTAPQSPTDRNGLTQTQLAKALQKRVISEDELAHYGHNLTFPADHDAKLIAVKAA